MQTIKIFTGVLVVIVIGLVSPSSACTPDCKGKQCGPDGCGGSCGTCQPPAQCVVDQCVKGCGGHTVHYGNFVESSCCYKGYALVCGNDESGGEFYWDIKKCSSPDECRWDDKFFLYSCDSSLSDYEDPKGWNPRECDFQCIPDCKGKECGPDGCGGTCGKCHQGDVCLDDGTCCHPDCTGRECGDDGCGGTCGYCIGGQETCEAGKCVNQYGCLAIPEPGCPDCACEQCVCKKDPSCCMFRWDDTCVQECKNKCGGCKKCVPDCQGKECGDDGCDGQCGYCKKGEKCEQGKCVKCVPDCDGKECGDDGCGGSCGKCSGSDVCDQGHCRPCKEHCEDWQNCGYSECGTEICQSQWEPNPGTPYCRSGAICRNNYCVPCVPYCRDRECGSDNCGGSCGKCGPCEQCISHQCKPIPDCVVPEPVPDTAEDVHIDRDAIEAADPGQTPTDSGKPGKDVRNDQKIAKDTSKDITGRLDSSRDGQATDAAGPDTNTKSSGGGCSTGPGSASGIWLILLSLLTLLLRRRQGE